MTQKRMPTSRAAVLVLLGLIGCFFGAAHAQANKPNILVVWGDDIGWYNISAYNLGVMGYRTPNIDRIAAEGALFTDWASTERTCPKKRRPCRSSTAGSFSPMASTK